MLRITVELCPYGDRSRAETIAEGQIVNTRTGTLEHGEYATQWREKSRRTGRWSRWRHRAVRNWPRQQRGPWALVAAALQGERL